MKKQNFINEWNNITLLKMFEIETIDKRTNDKEYVIFDIFLDGNKFVAYHVATTKREAKSKKIAYVQIKIDFNYSIDSNLEELYSACSDKIIYSDFFELI